MTSLIRNKKLERLIVIAVHTSSGKIFEKRNPTEVEIYQAISSRYSRVYGFIGGVSVTISRNSMYHDFLRGGFDRLLTETFGL